MRYRCELAGGQLQIASTPGGGTRIRCALPPDPTAAPLLAEAATVGDDEPMIENRMRA
jgi:signal transduction histidine kinase